MKDFVSVLVILLFAFLVMMVLVFLGLNFTYLELLLIGSGIAVLTILGFIFFFPKRGIRKKDRKKGESYNQDSEQRNSRG